MKSESFVALTASKVLRNALEALRNGAKTRTIMRNLSEYGLYLWEYRAGGNIPHVWIGNGVEEEDAPFVTMVKHPTREGLTNLLTDVA